MKNRLPAVAVRVYNDAIAVVGKPFFTCDLGRRKQQMPENFLLLQARPRRANRNAPAGSIRICVGACGEISLKAIQTSSS